MDTSEEGYKPSGAFEEESKDALIDIPDNDSTELWLIQWPMKQLDPADFHGKKVKLKLHHDGQLGGIESSSGKSYDMVSYAAQEPDATVFMPSASGSKVVGKISRRVCLVRYPDPEELEKPSFYNPNLSAMKSGGSTKKSSHRDTLTSTHSVGHRSLEFSSQSMKKWRKGNKPHTEASEKSNERSHTSGGGSQVTDRSLGSEQSQGEKSKKKKKMKAGE